MWKPTVDRNKIELVVAINFYLFLYLGRLITHTDIHIEPYMHLKTKKL